MESDSRRGLGTPIPIWLVFLTVSALIATGVAFAVWARSRSGKALPSSSGASANPSSANQPSVTVVPPQDSYTQLILPASPTASQLPPSVAADLGGGTAVKVPAGQVITIGDILLCTVGKPGSVQITSVAAWQAKNPVQVVGFSTRPNPVLTNPNAQEAGMNPGSLSESGFPSSGAEVTPCPTDYGRIFPGALRATEELGISVERLGPGTEHDNGFVLTYQGPSGPPRTLTVPYQLVLCSTTAKSCTYPGFPSF